MLYHHQSTCYYSRVRFGGDTANRIIDNVTWQVAFDTHKLVYHRDRYSEKQQQLYDLVMHLKSEGMGYRKVAKYLNAMGHKTHTGKEFTNTSIQFIVKRNHERIKMQEMINQEEKLVYGKMKINFWL